MDVRRNASGGLQRKWKSFWPPTKYDRVITRRARKIPCYVARASGRRFRASRPKRGARSSRTRHHKRSHDAQFTGARLCEPQQYGQPERARNDLKRVEFRALLRGRTSAWHPDRAPKQRGVAPCAPPSCSGSTPAPRSAVARGTTGNTWKISLRPAFSARAAEPRLGKIAPGAGALPDHEPVLIRPRAPCRFCFSD
jgi:hypothetical protein